MPTKSTYDDLFGLEVEGDLAMAETLINMPAPKTVAELEITVQHLSKVIAYFEAVFEHPETEAPARILFFMGELQHCLLETYQIINNEL